jgi:glycosidase
MRQTTAFLLLLTLLLTACIPQLGPQPEPWEDLKSSRWTDDAVFYQIFVRSFYDSDGDGIGDFAGITQKLDYLNDGKPDTDTDLGVTALWLMPIFPSPSYHGYDVTDYFTVNPQYGSMDDFKALLEAAHARDMRVIIDFVINHTSDQNPWFQASAAGEAPYSDYYIWSDTNPGYPGPWGQEVWHALGGRFYYGVFVREMPDLNYGSPAVKEEVEKIAAFWLNDVGVDGFRVDGAKHLIEKGAAQENTPETLAWFQDFRKFYQGAKPEAVAVGEVWSPSSETAPYVNKGAFDLVFNFPLADDILSAATFKDARRIANSLVQQEQAYADGRYAAFLSNHDQARVMTKVGGELPRAKAAATLLLTAPGTPFIYYGEEIGMTGDKPDPNIRTPMQWTGEPGAGFTTGTPWKAPNADLALHNVASAQADPQSLLRHYQALIRIRQNHHALRTGALVPVQTGSNMVFAVLRTTETESVLVLVNFSNEAAGEVKLRWDASDLRGTHRSTLLMGEGKPAPLNVDEAGAAAEFAPIPEIPAGGTVIIQYRP